MKALGGALLDVHARCGPSKCCDPQVQYQVFPVFTSFFLLSFFFPIPGEQIVGAPELDPDLAFLLDEANIDENAVNILRKNQLVTLRDFLNVEQELPQVRAMFGEMFGIKSDSNMGLKLQLSGGAGIWQVSRKESLRAGHRPCSGQGSR